MTKLAVIRLSRFHAPKAHKDVPKVELSSEGRVRVRDPSLMSKLKDAELSRAEAKDALESADKLNAKAASAFYAEGSDLIANSDAHPLVEAMEKRL